MKPIKRIGKRTQEWIARRQQWISEHPAPWMCYLCLTPLDIDTLTIDHRYSRTRRPDLKYSFDNLAPSCYDCNREKGSLSEDEYRKKMQTRQMQ